MTIERAIEIFYDFDRISVHQIRSNRKEDLDYNAESRKAYHMAIKSLEAWELVLEDIKKYDALQVWKTNNICDGYYMGKEVLDAIVGIIHERLGADLNDK